MSKWFESWFNTEYYHILYKHRDFHDARYFLSNLIDFLAPFQSAHILDLACGKGRHSIFLNEKGFEVTGADLSQESILEANKNSNEKLHFVKHDMREVLKEFGFDYVFNLFTSFGYFDSQKEDEQVIKSINGNLKENGVLVLDYMNAVAVEAGLVPVEDKQIDGFHFSITRKVEGNSIIKNIQVKDDEKVLIFQESVARYRLADFKNMLYSCGFDILEVFGDYSLNKFDVNSSPRLILLARKTNACSG